MSARDLLEAIRRRGVSPTMLLAAGGLLVGLAAFALGWWHAGRETSLPPHLTTGTGSPQAVQPASAPASAAARAIARATSSPGGDAAVPWPLWEFQLAQPIPERDPPRTPLPWRMIGASRAGGQWKLIVLRQGKVEPEYFGIGDKLPGGYRVTAISDEDVTLAQGRKTLILSYIGTQ